MSFSADWLRLREPHDAAARDRGLERHLAAWAGQRPGPLEVVDLGSGTGSNFRRLAPLLPPGQRWRLVELDPALIRAGSATLPPEPAWRYVRADLASELDAPLAPPVDLVTASALLDLVSEAWLARLAAKLRELPTAALLATLSYDGWIALEPAHPRDARVVELVNLHQRTDKGFGPALGPAATEALAGLLARDGAAVFLAPSDWALGPESAAAQRELFRGWADAAAAMAPGEAPAVAEWLRERLALLEAGRSRATVGHRDLLRLP